jgi:hypothetical protein
MEQKDLAFKYLRKALEIEPFHERSKKFIQYIESHSK